MKELLNELIKVYDMDCKDMYLYIEKNNLVDKILNYYEQLNENQKKLVDVVLNEDNNIHRLESISFYKNFPENFCENIKFFILELHNIFSISKDVI